MYEKRIQGAIKILNKHLPGWRDHILIKYFNMSSGCDCVLGQQPPGDFIETLFILRRKMRLKMVENSLVANAIKWAIKYGFALDEHEEHTYAQLTKEWKQALRQIPKTKRSAGSTT